MRRRLMTAMLIAACAAGAAAPARAGQSQAPARMTFQQAVARAVERNPSGLQAAEEILRADALLRQGRALGLPSVSAGVTETSLSYKSSVTPQHQVAGTVTATVPVYAPIQWALRVQLMDNRQIAEMAALDVRRQIAVATAQAYLSVVARQRVLDANLRASDTARAHFEFARQRRESGAGSRLNELRAQQSLSSVDVLVEQAQSDLVRAQEALGVFVAEDGPVTAADDPALEVPASLDAAIGAMPAVRTDLRLAAAREKAAARVASDSRKDWLPSLSALFQPQIAQPVSSYQPAFTFRFQLSGSIPVFDAGARAAKRAEREVLLKESQIALSGLLRQASADVRVAQAAVDRAARALASARAAARQAREVVEIVNVSFKVGASTNIEVIDAQRAALDADTAAAVAEDQLRQARLSLLVALGRFPQ